MARRVILDVDPGIDDALAILLALRSPEIDLIGVTTVAGNVSVERGTFNARAVLAAAGAPHIPVYQGAARPLAGRLTTATFFHGDDGLGGVQLGTTDAELSARESAVEAGGRHADQLLVDAARDAVTVVATGPLTNLARACQLDPAWPQRVEQVIVMGGAVACPGNVTPVAEANFYSDPEAAAIVLGSGAPITLVGLDVTMKAGLSPSRFERARLQPRLDATGDAVPGVAAPLIDAYLAVAARVGSETVALHDPLAVAVACDPSLVRTRRIRVEVELEGNLTRGQTVAWLSGKEERRVDRGDHDDVVGVAPVEGSIDVALEVDTDRFVDLFLDRLLRSRA